jgi:hypothetical protein
LNQTRSTYAEIASRAVQLLSGSDDSARTIDTVLLVDFGIAAAELADESLETPLARVIEMIDYRQHLMMTDEEVAAAVEHLQRRGLVRHEGDRLVFKRETWKVLPKNSSGRISATKRDRAKWVKLIGSTAS